MIIQADMQGDFKDKPLQQPWKDEALANVPLAAGKPRRLANGRLASDPDGSVSQQFPRDQPSPPHTCAETRSTSFPSAPPHVDEHTPHQPQGPQALPAINRCVKSVQATGRPYLPTALHSHLASPFAAPPAQQHVYQQHAQHATPALAAHPTHLLDGAVPRQHELALSAGQVWSGPDNGKDVGAARGSSRQHVQSRVHLPGAPPASASGSASLHQRGRGAALVQATVQATVQGPAGGPVLGAGLQATCLGGSLQRLHKRQRLQPVDGEGEQAPFYPGMEHLREEHHPQQPAVGQYGSSPTGHPHCSSPRVDGAAERPVGGRVHGGGREGSAPPSAPPGTRSPGRLGAPACRQTGGGWGAGGSDQGMGPSSGAHASASGGWWQALGHCGRTAHAAQSLLLPCEHQPASECGYGLWSASGGGPIEHCGDGGGDGGRGWPLADGDSEAPAAARGHEREQQHQGGQRQQLQQQEQQDATLSQGPKQVQEQGGRRRQEEPEEEAPGQARSHAPQPPHRKRPELISMHHTGSQQHSRSCSQSQEGPSHSLRSGQQGHGCEQGLGTEGGCRSVPQAQGGADGLLARPPRSQSHVPSGDGAGQGVPPAAPRRGHRVAPSQSFSGPLAAASLAAAAPGSTTRITGAGAGAGPSAAPLDTNAPARASLPAQPQPQPHAQHEAQLPLPHSQQLQRSSQSRQPRTETRATFCPAAAQSVPSRGPPAAPQRLTGSAVARAACAEATSGQRLPAQATAGLPAGAWLAAGPPPEGCRPRSTSSSGSVPAGTKAAVPAPAPTPALAAAAPRAPGPAESGRPQAPPQPRCTSHSRSVAAAVVPAAVAGPSAGAAVRSVAPGVPATAAAGQPEVGPWEGGARQPTACTGSGPARGRIGPAGEAVTHPFRAAAQLAIALPTDVRLDDGGEDEEEGAELEGEEAVSSNSGASERGGHNPHQQQQQFRHRHNNPQGALATAATIGAVATAATTTATTPPAAAGRSLPAAPAATGSPRPPQAAAWPACISHLHGHVPAHVGLPPLQLGELRVCGLTFHPRVAAWVRIGMEAWQRGVMGWLRAQGLRESLAVLNPAQLQMHVLGSGADGFLPYGVEPHVVCAGLARYLGLYGRGKSPGVGGGSGPGEGEEWGLPLPEGPLELVGVEPCAWGAGAGAGGEGGEAGERQQQQQRQQALRTTRRVRRSAVFGVVGGYVLPGDVLQQQLGELGGGGGRSRIGTGPEGPGRGSQAGWRGCSAALRSRLAGRAAAAGVELSSAWRFLLRAFHAPFPAEVSTQEEGEQEAHGAGAAVSNCAPNASGGPGPGPGSSLELVMLGYGNLAALVNDPRANPRAWQQGNDVELGAGQAPAHHPGANCAIVPVVVRGLVLPVLVALRDIAPGEQLLRDYGADWWQAAAAQWREMEEQAGAGAGAGAGPGGLGSVADTLLGAGGAGTYLKEA